MQWQFSYRNQFRLSQGDSIKLPLLFEKDAFLVQVMVDSRSPVAYLQQYLFIEGFGEVVAERFQLRQGHQLFQTTPLFPYRLYLEPGRADRIEVSIWLPDTNLGGTMPLSNPASVTVQQPTSSAATSSSVAASISSVTLLASNANRKGATIWNDSTATLYVDLDGTASATDFTAQLSPGGYYELPFGYTGAISGIWSAANGNARVRELT
jgi:hypothetical protein